MTNGSESWWSRLGLNVVAVWVTGGVVAFVFLYVKDIAQRAIEAHEQKETTHPSIRAEIRQNHDDILKQSNTTSEEQAQIRTEVMGIKKDVEHISESQDDMKQWLRRIDSKLDQ